MKTEMVDFLVRLYHNKGLGLFARSNPQLILVTLFKALMRDVLEGYKKSLQNFTLKLT